MQATDTPSIIHRYFMIKNSSFQTCNTLNIKALELYYNIKKWNIELDTLTINIRRRQLSLKEKATIKKGTEKASLYRMTRVIHIDDPSHPVDKSLLFACQYLSLILLVTMLHPNIHNKNTHYFIKSKAHRHILAYPSITISK